MESRRTSTTEAQESLSISTDAVNDVVAEELTPDQVDRLMKLPLYFSELSGEALTKRVLDDLIEQFNNNPVRRNIPYDYDDDAYGDEWTCNSNSGGIRVLTNNWEITLNAKDSVPTQSLPCCSGKDDEYDEDENFSCHTMSNKPTMPEPLTCRLADINGFSLESRSSRGHLNVSCESNSSNNVGVGVLDIVKWHSVPGVGYKGEQYSEYSSPWTPNLCLERDRESDFGSLHISFLALNYLLFLTCLKNPNTKGLDDTYHLPLLRNPDVECFTLNQTEMNDLLIPSVSTDDAEENKRAKYSLSAYCALFVCKMVLLYMRKQCAVLSNFDRTY